MKTQKNDLAEMQTN
jgi:hypothetical protein